VNHMGAKPCRRAVFIGLAVVVCLAVSACGRRGNPHPPAGEESQYSYPKFYPNPESTLEVRRSDLAPDTTLATDSEIEAREEEFDSTYGSRYKQSNDGYNRTRTRVYGWE
jgi:hypothetical protein